MVVYLQHLKKKKGGRLAFTDTYRTQCANKKEAHASWNIHRTLQSIEESNDVDAFVGTTKDLYPEEFVVKVMPKNGLSVIEKHIQKYFVKHPHRHIIQTICWFTCKDNPIRWKKHVHNQNLCLVKGNQRVQVILQEFIPRGDLHTLQINDIHLWTSLLLQLVYGYIELYTKHGLLYNDWHSGNVLIDEEQSQTLSYDVFGKVKTVIVIDRACPVLTDFARSSIHSPATLEPWQLASQLTLVIEMMTIKCPNPLIKHKMTKLMYTLGEAKTMTSIQRLIEKCQSISTRL